MVEAKAKRARGRPKGSRNKVAKPLPNVAEAQVSDAEIAEALETWKAGNGRDEPKPVLSSKMHEELAEHREEMHRQWEQAATEPVEPAPATERFKGSVGMWTAERPPEPAPRVVLPDLFIHRVENGYIVRPAYAQGDHRTSSDVRTWVVATKEQLAALVVELIAEPVVHTAPVRQSQNYFSPPLIVETGVG